MSINVESSCTVTGRDNGWRLMEKIVGEYKPLKRRADEQLRILNQNFPGQRSLPVEERDPLYQETREIILGDRNQADKVLKRNKGELRGRQRYQRYQG